VSAASTPPCDLGLAPSDIVHAPGRLSWWRRYPAAVPWSLAALFFALYTALSVRAHQRMLTSGYDLGIFVQAVRGYSEGHPPISDLLGPGFNQLGDHFSPILATLAPIYRLFPTPVTLLVAQAALLALTVVPLMRWAARTLGTAAALVVGFGVGASYGIQEAVGFDFHEVCFAVPMLAFSLEAFGNRRWHDAALWAFPLLLVKEDLGLTVGVLGLLLARQQRRLGLACAAVGIAGSALEVLVLIPSFNPGGEYRFWEFAGFTGGGWAPEFLWHTPVDLLTSHVKVQTLIMLAAPTAFVALRSPLILLAVPTLAWRLLSTNPSFWGTDHQYGAVLMPIVFAAFIEALIRMAEDSGTRTIRAALATSVGITTLLIPQLPLAGLLKSATWQTDQRVLAARRMLDRIPDGTTVAATNMLIPQISSRCTAFVFPSYPVPGLRTEWIVAEELPPELWPYSSDDQARYLADARAAGYRTVADENGLVLLHRG
jgi:uncharacterized membrane protein